MFKKALLYDIAERTMWTFLQGALGTITIGNFLGVSVWKGAAIAGAAAVFAAIKGIVASKVGLQGTASTLPETLSTGVVKTVTSTVDAAGSLVNQTVDTAVGTVGEVVSGVVGIVPGNLLGGKK